MKPVIMAQPTVRSPRAFVVRSLRQMERELRRSKLRAQALRRLDSVNEVSVVFVKSSEIRRLNREFRQKDRPTDILSFDPSEPQSLGELVIAVDVIRRQAKEHDLSLNQELGYMLLHGVLHLLGYDHGTKMFGIQDSIFERLKDSWK